MIKQRNFAAAVSLASAAKSRTVRLNLHIFIARRDRTSRRYLPELSKPGVEIWIVKWKLNIDWISVARRPSDAGVIANLGTAAR
jgi:hypothetical protein